MASRLSLAAKLYSIFALFAVLVAAITALSQYNTSQNAELTEQVSIASRAALNVERINSLVYAVVMESRGVYMSAEPAVVKKYGDGLLKFNGRILEVVKNWQALVQDDDAQQFATFKKRIEQFIDFRKELVRRGVEINGAAGREWGDNDANREVRTALNKDLEALSKVYAERSKRLAQQTDTNHTLAFVLTCLGVLALAVVVLGVLIIARSIAPAAFGHYRNHQAGRRRRRRRRGSAYRPLRRDRRARPCDQDLPGGDGPQPQPQFAGTGGFEGARRAHPSYRGLGRRLPGSDRRRAARRHRQCHLDARHRPVHCQRLVGCHRARGGGLRRDRAGLQQRFRRGQRRGGAFSLGRGNRPPGAPIGQRRRAGGPAHR